MRFRGIIAERTDAIKQELEQVRAARHGSADAAEREGLEDRFQELDGRYRKASKACWTRSCPRRSPRCAKPAAGWWARTVIGHGPRPDLGHGAVRRAADRRHRAAPGADRRDGDRRRQDAGRHAAALPERARRPRRAPRHRQRLPRPPRLEWMGQIFKCLGLTVGCIDDTEPVDAGAPRRLRLPTSPTARTTSSASTTCATTWCSRWSIACSASTYYAIVDEVDSVLIDEARTPLIISGPVGARAATTATPQFNRRWSSWCASRPAS